MMWQKIQQHQILLAGLCIMGALLTAPYLNRYELVQLNMAQMVKFNKMTADVELVCNIQANTCEKWERDREFYERIRDEEREKAAKKILKD